MIINGKRIYLRRIVVPDINERYLSWMRDPRVYEFLESRFEKWTVRKLKDYVKRVSADPDYLFMAIISKKGNRHIGNIKLGPINRHHRSAEIGIIIGDKLFWGKGCATEAIRLITAHAFKKLKLHKLTAGAYANNMGSVKAFKRAGFSIEGIRKKHYLHRGKYVDGVLLGIINK